MITIKLKNPLLMKKLSDNGIKLVQEKSSKIILLDIFKVLCTLIIFNVWKIYFFTII